MSNLITAQNFKEYRAGLGFTKQDDIKNFFGAKDMIATVDFNYINSLNNRLAEIITKIDSVVSQSVKTDDITIFCDKHINDVFQKLKDNNIIERLNNQGRRPEQVYFSWMRGYVISNYFLKALSEIFEISTFNIKSIGSDDLENINSFKRSPTTDLELLLKDGNRLRIEVQSGFQGVNDIKQHKVIEAKKIAKEEKISSFAIHFDLFNGQVAFIQLDTIKDNSVNWIVRSQMEGQTVFNIDQNYFIWKLIENPPKFHDVFVQQ